MDSFHIVTSILSDMQEKLGHKNFYVELVSVQIKAFKSYCKDRNRIAVFIQNEEYLHSFIFSDDFKTLIHHDTVPSIQKKRKFY